MCVVEKTGETSSVTIEDHTTPSNPKDERDNGELESFVVSPDLMTVTNCPLQHIVLAKNDT